MKALRAVAWLLAGLGWGYLWMVLTAVACALGWVWCLGGLALLWAAVFGAALCGAERTMAAAWVACVGCAFGAVFVMDRSNWPSSSLLQLIAVFATTAFLTVMFPGGAMLAANKLRARRGDDARGPVAERSPRFEPRD